MKMQGELPPKKRRSKNKITVIFLEMKQRRLNMRKPLSVFEILLKMEVEKPFAFKQMYFHPCCRVLVVKCFVVSNMCHFLKIDCEK